MKFSNWLQDKILKSGKTRKEIAKLAGIPKNKLDGFCNGKAYPSSFQVVILSNALGIYVDEMECMISGKETTLKPVIPHTVADLKELSEQAEKPGEKPKSAKIKNSPQRIHDIKVPESKHCRKCDIEKGTECFRHAESRIIKFLAGGGIVGGKIPDTLSAWLCYECDKELSEPLSKDASWQQERTHALDWAICILKTYNV